MGDGLSDQSGTHRHDGLQKVHTRRIVSPGGGSGPSRNERCSRLRRMDRNTSQQDLDNSIQTNRANKAQVEAAKAAIGAAKAQIQANQAAVEAAMINLNFTTIVSPIDGIAGIAQAQVGDLVSSGSGNL